MENSTKSSGIGCLSVIGIVFIILHKWGYAFSSYFCKQ